jgi:formate/nitrite transporter
MGFVMIVLLGMELVTGSFALLPLAVAGGRSTPGHVVRNWAWVFVGNLLGSVAYAALLAIVLTTGWAGPPNAVGQAVIKIAEAKTIGYASAGFPGLLTVFVKAMLCNWMVCLGVVMSMVSTSVVGKIAAMWLPIVIFFAQGFEHSVVNMFVIPAGMLMGANVSVADWWIWNQIPVTLGNIVGGAIFTGMAMYYSYAKKAPAPAISPVAGVVPSTESGAG